MISVLMTTYREPLEILRASVESILSQTYRDLEFIVILDDPDNQPAMDLLFSFAEADPRLKVEINASNLKQRKSLNRALELATGEYVARMDADDISLPERLELQLDYLTRNDLDLIGGLVQIMDEEGNVSEMSGIIKGKVLNVLNNQLN